MWIVFDVAVLGMYILISSAQCVCVCVFVQYQLQGNTVSDLFRRVLQVWFVKYLIFSKYPPHYSGS